MKTLPKLSIELRDAMAHVATDLQEFVDDALVAYEETSDAYQASDRGVAYAAWLEQLQYLSDEIDASTTGYWPFCVRLTQPPRETTGPRPASRARRAPG